MEAGNGLWYRPGADSVARAFRGSGKTGLVLTGSDGEAISALLETLAGEGLPCGDSREDGFRVDLDRPYGNLGCVILASGLGRRFGGNKLMAPFRGRPMIAWALEATAGIFRQRVVVTRHPEVARLCRRMEISAVLHDLPLRSDTVRLGLEALGQVEGCLFCPGDQPLLGRETVAALALGAVNEPERILRPAFEGKPGAPVLFPAWAFAQLRQLPPGAGGGAVIRRYPDRVGLIPAGEKELMDADTPEMLARLAAWEV